jgi:diketogulonate reductase-like aldo/keto reductase
MEPSSRTVTLDDGQAIPIIGFGTYRLRRGDETRRAVAAALEAGYRHVDTATVYGNEADVGAAVRASGVPRDDVFITTKLWNADHRDPRGALEASLQRLGTDHVDLWLMHWPVGQRLRTWPVMEQARRDGLTRSIGVSNFLARHLAELLPRAQVHPAVNQIEMSPFLFGTRRDTVAATTDAGIVLEAYSPLTKGVRLDHPVVARIARHAGSTAAQVLLAWCFAHGFVALPRSRDQGRIRENLGALDVGLDQAAIAELDALDEGLTTGWDPARSA